MKVVCAVCESVFEAKRATAKFCGDRCRQLAKRRRDQGPDAPADVAVDVPGIDASAGLVSAVRKELAAADRVETVPGQMALVLAGQAAAPGATGVPGLIKELRVALAEALVGVAPVVKDEVTEARERRESKAREAQSR